MRPTLARVLRAMAAAIDPAEAPATCKPAFVIESASDCDPPPEPYAGPNLRAAYEGLARMTLQRALTRFSPRRPGQA